MAKYKLIIAYDGTDFVGWQKQKSGISIQGELERALSTILREKTVVTGAGRTDAGVHAMGQTAHFSTKKTDHIQKLIYAANALLPKEIRILHGEEVDGSFHARFSAISKIYHYRLYLGKVQLPFEKRYSLHIKQTIDLDLLKKATLSFIGTKDFRSFANEQNKGCAKNRPIKTIKRLDYIFAGEMLTLQFEGDGFLYKMVRNITGALLKVARGKMDLSMLPQMLMSKDRKQAPECAPAHGLFLMEVKY